MNLIDHDALIREHRRVQRTYIILTVIHLAALGWLSWNAWLR